MAYSRTEETKTIPPAPLEKEEPRRSCHGENLILPCLFPTPGRMLNEFLIGPEPGHDPDQFPQGSCPMRNSFNTWTPRRKQSYSPCGSLSVPSMRRLSQASAVADTNCQGPRRRQASIRTHSGPYQSGPVQFRVRRRGCQLCDELNNVLGRTVRGTDRSHPGRDVEIAISCCPAQ
jgi:hypothetical protein